MLVVSPHFPPTSAADMHRVRMLLPFLTENGWEAEVLAVEPSRVAAPTDPWLIGGLPADMPIHRVSALGGGWCRVPGLGTLGLRALPALARGGDAVLSARAFDLVFFSTTMFEVHALGPRWKRRFGVPFAMDYQDLWVSDYYREHPEITPPGGRLKYAAATALHRWMEPRVLRACSAITAVSPDYPRQLARRYPHVGSLPTLVQPFPGSIRDFEALPTHVPVPHFDPGDGRRHWVYVGRGGADMAQALRGLFRALAVHADPELLASLQLHFIGTSYARAGTGMRSVEPIAREFGLGHIVGESPDRIDFSQALATLRAAHALVVPGSDDPAYTASKIYPYLLAGRPLLAVFHERSSVVELMARVGGGTCVPFSTGEGEGALAARIARQWLDTRAHEQRVPLDAVAFEPYTDRRAATELSEFLHRVVDSGTRA